MYRIYNYARTPDRQIFRAALTEEDILKCQGFPVRGQPRTFRNPASGRGGDPGR